MKYKNYFLYLIIFSLVGILGAAFYHIFFYNEKKYLEDKEFVSRKQEKIIKEKAICFIGECKNIGDVVALGNEKFYVINNDGKNIQMITKYNLDVAGVDFKYLQIIIYL